MALAEDFEKTLAFKCVAGVAEELGAHIIFWKESRARTSLKVDMVVFVKTGVTFSLMEQLHQLLLPRLQAFCAPLDVGLEISSPGTQRTIKSLYELPFFLGKNILFFLEDQKLEGVLEAVKDKEIVIRLASDECLCLLKEELKGARIKT